MIRRYNATGDTIRQRLCESFLLCYHGRTMDKPKVTPKDFFLWVGAMIALYASAVAFVALVFDYINYAFPDSLQYYYGDPYSRSISYEMASLIVLFPVFYILMRVIRRAIERDPSRSEVWVRKWALFLVLFVAGATVVGDLITLIMYFLNGDVTVRFLLKVLVIFLVAGGGFLHFFADMRGYWKQEPKKARLAGFATAALVAFTIVSGFFIVGTPWEARLYRYDEQKVQNLNDIQYQILNYWQSKGKLPAALTDLQDSISGYFVPTDPQSGAQDVYQPTGALSFKLCATFNAETQAYSSGSTRVVTIAPMAIGETGKPIQDSWQHGGGEVCFERTIDPQIYAPYPKQKLQ